MTDAERKQRERDKLRASGKVRRDVWVYPSVWDKVRAYVERRNKEAERMGNDANSQSQRKNGGASD